MAWKNSTITRKNFQRITKKDKSEKDVVWGEEDIRQKWRRIDTVKFTYQELARLNRMIGVALMSGKIKFDEISESVFNKVTEEIQKRALENEPEKEVV